MAYWGNGIISNKTFTGTLDFYNNIFINNNGVPITGYQTYTPNVVCDTITIIIISTSGTWKIIGKTIYITIHIIFQTTEVFVNGTVIVFTIDTPVELQGTFKNVGTGIIGYIPTGTPITYDNPTVVSTGPSNIVLPDITPVLNQTFNVLFFHNTGPLVFNASVNPNGNPELGQDLQLWINGGMPVLPTYNPPPEPPPE